jgi:phosphoglycerate dehydrogenase-like enzyme
LPEIVRALTTLSLNDEGLSQLRRAIAPGSLVSANRFNPLAITTAVREADVAFLHGDLDHRILAGPKLRWIHCGHGGVERSAKPEVFERGILLTSAAGRSAPALAEHVLFFMLALSFDFPRIYEAQKVRRWGVRRQRDLRALKGRTVGLIGLGHIGSEIVRRARAFDMRIIAYRRRADRCPGVDELFSADKGDKLDTLLSESDFVVLAVPLTDLTHHFIGDEQLSLMKSSAYLINIARGGLVDEASLIAALKERRIAGAAIDVAETEPLPAASPLWTAPNLIITPHVTPQLSDGKDRALDILCENIRRYRSGEPLLNSLTIDDVFTHTETPDSDVSRLTAVLRRSQALAHHIVHRLHTR